MELFAYKCRLDEEGYPINLDAYNGMSTTIGVSPRENFDQLLNAITTIFIVLIGDGWNNVMYNYARTVGHVSILFFVTLVILGKMILMNLFLAILLRNFGEEESMISEGIEESTLDRVKRFFIRVYKHFANNRFLFSSNKIQDDQQSSSKHMMSQEMDSVNPGLSSVMLSNVVQLQTLDQQTNRSIQQHRRQVSSQSDSISRSDGHYPEQESRRQLITSQQENATVTEQGPLSHLERIKQSYQEKLKSLQNKRKRKSVYVSKVGHSNELFRQQTKRLLSWVNPYKLDKKSLCLFRKRSIFRHFFAKLVNHKLFDPFILVIITLSTIALALDNPLNDPNGKMTMFLSKCDIFFTSVFCIECVAKIITYGFIINGKQSYLLNPWNTLDFIIVVFALVSVVPNDHIDFKFMKAIRMLRVVRPLRVISTNQGLRIAILSLLNSIVGILHVFTISFLFFLLFGIFGINYFKGQFRKCYIDHIEYDYYQGIYDKWTCENIGGEWINLDHNFDNIIQAIKTLFEMSSTEGWTDVMWSGVDSNGIDNLPVEQSRPFWVIFFMLFLLFGSLFIMNLFVGVVINTFNNEREKLGKNHILSTFQKEWVLMQISFLKVKPLVKLERIYKNKFRNWISIISFSTRFEITILTFIILNTLCLGIEWYNQSAEANFVLDMINYAFAIIFTFEFLIRLVAYGFKGYFSLGWNVLDFLVVVGTIISVFITFFTTATFGASTTLIRSIRIGRILKLVSKANFLKTIFNTFVITLPSLANIGGLLVLLIYVFSILGIYLFADIKLQNFLEQHANFQTFDKAFLTLIRCATGESWNYIMDDCARTKSIIFDCKAGPTYQDYVNNGYVTLGCGDKTTAYTFFISFTLLVTMIFLNLFIAIILESFENVNQQEDLKINDNDIEIFLKAWLKYDLNGTGFLAINDFEMLLIDLAKSKSTFLRQGDDILNDYTTRRHFIEELELPTYQKMQSYNQQDIMYSLAKAAIHIDIIQGKYTRQNVFTDNNSQKSKTQEEINQLNLLCTEINIDDEIMNIEKLNKKHQIQLVNDYLKLKQKIDEVRVKNVDQFDGNIYNSRFVFFVIQLKAKVKSWYLRKKKEQQIKEQMGQQIILTLGLQMIPGVTSPTQLPPCNLQQLDLNNNNNISDQNIQNNNLSESQDQINDDNKQKIRNEDEFQSQDPDMSSQEIQNLSNGEENNLNSAKEKLKISRQKRQEFLFSKKFNSNQTSTFDSDLNSLIKQLSGNQEQSSNSVNQSLRESEHSEQNIDFYNRKNIDTNRNSFKVFDKEWLKQGPNCLNTIISEKKQEESLSTSRLLQKSNDSKMTPGSPISSAQQRHDASVPNFNSYKSPDNQSQLQSHDNLLTNEKFEEDSQQEKPQSQQNQFLNLLTDENLNYFKVNTRQNTNKQQKQQLTVSFGMSEQQHEEKQDDNFINFQGEFQKNSDKSLILPTFEDESPINQNDSIQLDSPKFIPQKIQNNNNNNRINEHDISNKRDNLRKRLTELVQNKNDQQKLNKVHNKLANLLKKPNSQIVDDNNIKPQNIINNNLVLNNQIDFNPKQQQNLNNNLNNDNEDIIIVGSIYTDQSNSSKHHSEKSIEHIKFYQ